MQAVFLRCLEIHSLARQGRGCHMKCCTMHASFRFTPCPGGSDQPSEVLPKQSRVGSMPEESRSRSDLHGLDSSAS